MIITTDPVCFRRENVLLQEWWLLSDGTDIDEPEGAIMQILEPDRCQRCGAANPMDRLFPEHGAPISLSPELWHHTGLAVWRAANACTPEAGCKQQALRIFLVAARLLPRTRQGSPCIYSPIQQDASVAEALLGLLVPRNREEETEQNLKGMPTVGAGGTSRLNAERAMGAAVGRALAAVRLAGAARTNIASCTDRCAGTSAPEEGTETKTEEGSMTGVCRAYIACCHNVCYARPVPYVRRNHTRQRVLTDAERTEMYLYRKWMYIAREIML